jgi:hypothetical protein
MAANSQIGTGKTLGLVADGWADRELAQATWEQYRASRSWALSRLWHRYRRPMRYTWNAASLLSLPGGLRYKAFAEIKGWAVNRGIAFHHADGNFCDNQLLFRRRRSSSRPLNPNAAPGCKTIFSSLLIVFFATSAKGWAP